MPDPNAKLTKASIRFDTPPNRDNKDWNTKVSVFVRNRFSLFLTQDLAELVDFAGDTEFKDPSSHSFDLVLKSDGILLKDITVPTVQIRITPNGNDRWIFGYTVALSFSDGTNFSSTKDGIILDQDNRIHEAVLG
ncbi:MAG: hypothetical protein HY291_00285 [Planctomycetes bacterium]|nr:hypothetical protein [Planctomycetota bacterium]